MPKSNGSGTTSDYLHIFATESRNENNTKYFFIMTQKYETNEATVAGFINDVHAINELPDGKTSIHAKVTTYYDTKEERLYTHHNVNVVTSDEKQVEMFRQIAKDVAKENEEKKPHTIVVTGHLATRHNNKTDKDQQVLVASGETVTFDVPLYKGNKGQTMNGIVLEGIIADIVTNKEYKFARVRIAHHYPAPGAGKLNGKDNDEMHTETQFLNAIVYGDRLGNYDKIVNGEIAKGDRVLVKGPMINNDYTVGEEKIYTMDIRIAAQIHVISKAKAKTEKEEVKEAPKAAKAEKKEQTKKAAAKTGETAAPKKAKPKKNTVKVS